MLVDHEKIWADPSVMIIYIILVDHKKIWTDALVMIIYNEAKKTPTTVNLWLYYDKQTAPDVVTS